MLPKKGKRLVVSVWLVIASTTGNAFAAGHGKCNFLEGAGPTIVGGLEAPGLPQIKLEIPRDYLPEEITIEKTVLGARGSILVRMYIETSRPYMRSKENRDAKPFSSWFSALIRRSVDIRRALTAYQDVYFRGQRELSRPFLVEGTEFLAGTRNDEYDLIVPEDPSALRDVLLCSKAQQEKGVVNPLCRHRTNIDGLNVELVYSRRYLADWQKIKSQFQEFITCVTVRI